MRNPVIYADYPDLDVIRVGDTYYMISTTMHMFPGGDLLMSKDLVHWELCCHIFDRLDSTPAQRLEEGHIYGKGMWAASLRYHEGLFHAFFVCNDAHRSYHYTAENPAGPWAYHPVEGFFHDCSILFDDDGRVYLAYGNREIHIQEMKPDLSGPKEGGLHRIALVDTDDVTLGFEGTHLYKLNGYYYLFMIHWHRDGHGRRTEACYRADSIEGVFTGKDILDDDMGFFNQGVAQGGIVDTPDGKWYAMLFQDHGACGRMPVLVPMRWEDDFPVMDGAPVELTGFPEEPEKPLHPLISSDALCGEGLENWWQWNHEPDMSRVRFTEKGVELHAGPAVKDFELARNTLTQRTSGPKSAFEVTVDASHLQEGDRAGLAALQGCYALLCVEKTADGWRLVLCERNFKEKQGHDTAFAAIASPVVRLRAEFDFGDLNDKAHFFYLDGGEWKPVGEAHQLRYTLDHFMGTRIGLCCYSAEKDSEGYAVFRDFEYQAE